MQVDYEKARRHLIRHEDDYRGKCDENPAPNPTPVGQAWRRFPIKFYVTAMLFVLFDIEVIFFFPWAVILRHIKGAGEQYIWFIVAEMLVFIAFLLLGYVYILKRRALEWE